MTPFLRLASLAVLSCLALLRPASAAEVTGLNEVRVPVASQSAGDRARAVDEGFRQLLVKMSGQRAVLALPALQPELGKGDALLGSFQYESQPVRPAGTGASPLLLRLTFDQPAVRAILNRAGAPVWGTSRPSVYLWVARDGAAGRTVLGFGTPAADVLLDAAGQRGLPALLPGVGDTAVSDPLTVSIPAPVAEAAASAGGKAVVAAVLSSAPGRSRAAGLLAVDGAVERLDATGADEAAALRELVQQAADRLGARYAVVTRQDQLQAVRLRVTGVRTLEEHAALERWLAGLPLVRDLVPERVEAGGLEFLLALAGDVDRLLQAMAADGRLVVAGQPQADGPVSRVEAAWVAPPATP